MIFNKENYTVETVTLGEESLRFRAFRNRIYVDKPINSEFQQMHIFAPEAYYEGESVQGYTLETAPIFMPNTVGGYMPGGLEEPGLNEWQDEKKPNTIFRALQHGYVVAVPAIRGRVQRNGEGLYTGKAPACIVDYKAAVRYLHYFAEEIPGDVNKIITNGTSAGGALSSLMGATGNHPDYESFLEEIGAAKASDAVFAASCYCPIINLEHADMAYEWQFDGIYGTITEAQIKVSKEEAKLFPSYVNLLGLHDGTGKKLTLDGNGNGSFKEHMESIVLASAQKALEQGIDLSDKEWLTIENGRAVAMDFHGYAEDITRMKNPPAFDKLSMDSIENDLFGSATENFRHFTKYSREHSLAAGLMAEDSVIKMMNPMNYIEDEAAQTAFHWRIRHGECDRDTSLAISAMFVLKLRSGGHSVDYHAPWNVPHAGDYDLEELFAWIDGICKEV